MKDKILKTVHDKICVEFETTFLPSKQFEKELSDSTETILEKLSSLTDKYLQLKKSKIKKNSSQVVKIDRETYIKDEFKKFQLTPTSYKSFSDLDDSPSANQRRIEYYGEKYDEKFKNDDDEIVVTLIKFIKNNTLDSILSEEQENELNENVTINELFWTFFHNKYSNNDWQHTYKKENEEAILNSKENVIQAFKEDYLSNQFLLLLDTVEKYISDENLSGFETYIVNVGVRDFETNRSGWTTTYFKVINNEKIYLFTSSKDERGIKGLFVNVFILQKKYLIKLSITLNEAERTPYIIQKDCEKISLKNECEIIIAKHHGNETIVFDTRKQALAFQTKLIEIREGNQSFNKNK